MNENELLLSIKTFFRIRGYGLGYFFGTFFRVRKKLINNISLIFCKNLYKIVMNLIKYYKMATRTFHISFPMEWAKEIEKEMKEEHFSPTEYFKNIYRQVKQQREYADFQDSMKCYKAEKNLGKLKKLTSLKDLMK